MTIACTCGCKVDDFDDVINCSLKGWARDWSPCVDYVSYCPVCYKRAKELDLVLYNEEAETNWLFNGDKE